MPSFNVAKSSPKFGQGANRPAAVYCSTYDVARALHLSPVHVRRIVDAGGLACTRIAAGNRLMLRAAVLELVRRRAAEDLELVPHVVHHPERTPATPQQLPLFHVRRMAKVGGDVRHAKRSRMGWKSFGVR